MLKLIPNRYLPFIIALIAIITFSFEPPIKPKIGFMLANLKTERWKKDCDFFISSANAMGYDVIVTNAFDDPDKQIQNAKKLIDSDVKALVIIPVDARKVAPIIDIAHKAGIKVVAYDRLLLDCDLDAYIAYDSEMVGQIMAIYTTIRKKNGNFMYIGGPKYDMNSTFIHNGLTNGLKQYTDKKEIVMICDTFVSKWNTDEAGTILTGYIESGLPIPDVIFAANDHLAENVITVLEKYNLAGKVLVTGQDAELAACRNIVAGKQLLTIFKPIRTLADRAVMLTIDVLSENPSMTYRTINNGFKDVPFFPLGPVPVDKNNMSRSVIFDNFHTSEEIYK